MWYSCITTLAIGVFIEEDAVFTVICNPNTSISKIAERAFSCRQNAENEHYETLKKLVYK